VSAIEPTPASELVLRQATVADLDGANAVIEAAINGWNLPERVKRLSLSSYRYNSHDLAHLTLIAAETKPGNIVGVVAWEPADTADAPAGKRALLLHGIYVDPDFCRKGIGSRLLKAAEETADNNGFDGLLVKANRDAQAFFLAKGLQQLSVEDPKRDYPYRFWKAFDHANSL